MVEVAKRILASIREGDTASRFGGDEFLILLEGELTSAVIKEITDRIQTTMSEPIIIEGNEFRITASIGIAFATQEVTDVNEYLRNANIAMYKAKALGGARTEIFTQTTGLTSRRKIAIETAVRKAVKDKEFILNYQPIYNLDTLSITGVEVLLRWKRKDTLISPTKFIPMLEKFGLMPELGRWIMETAVNNYQTWKSNNQGVGQLTLSVNISNLQLIRDDFVSQVVKLIAETKMDPTKLILEITEHVLIDDLQLAGKKIRALNNLGVHVHLDDFGTGYSSLAHLNDLPVQALKIDRKFIKEIDSTEMNKTLVWSILSMARKFKVAVIAEGIETEDQLQGLRFAECQYGQGFFLSPALSEEDLLALLKTSPFSSG